MGLHIVFSDAPAGQSATGIRSGGMAMPSLVSGSEYVLLIAGFIGCLVIAVVATLISMIRKRK
jgi:hypothetical protein